MTTPDGSDALVELADAKKRLIPGSWPYPGAEGRMAYAVRTELLTLYRLAADHQQMLDILSRHLEGALTDAAALRADLDRQRRDPRG